MAIPTVGTPISKERLAELLAKMRAAKAASPINTPESLEEEANIASEEVDTISQQVAEYKTYQSPDGKDIVTNHPLDMKEEIDADYVELSAPADGILTHDVGMHGESIEYNADQLAFIKLAAEGKSCILIGAAGTGKTTATRGAIGALIRSGRAGILHAHGHKHLTEEGTTGIVAVSYTRRAVTNLCRALPTEMQGNTLTIHKLLEYQPVYYTVIDPATGEEKNTMRFEATRNRFKPLPSSIHTVIIDESSMVSVELFKELLDALPHNVQFVFLGDIQQLPPVFGSAILGFKMLELATIELTIVYRQALESPIIRLAHRILSGKPIPAVAPKDDNYFTDGYADWKFPGQLTIHPWKKKLSSDLATLTLAKFLTGAIDSGIYDPLEDMILIPFNKATGTEELNKYVAHHLAKSTGAAVWEVIAGFNKLYFHVGCKVMYEREDAEVISIVRNGTYLGKRAQHESVTLDYWGHNSGPRTVTTGDDDGEFSEEALELLLESAASGDDERVRQASHILTLRILDSDTEVEVDTASELNKLLLGYALTIHKAQGSEWRKVFLLLHQSHATMISRELLYTAVTRAREELYIICETDTFTKGILSQRIKGNTLAEKAIFFQGKLDSNNGQY